MSFLRACCWSSISPTRRWPCRSSRGEPPRDGVRAPAGDLHGGQSGSREAMMRRGEIRRSVWKRSRYARRPARRSDPRAGRKGQTARRGALTAPHALLRNASTESSGRCYARPLVMLVVAIGDDDMATRWRDDCAAMRSDDCGTTHVGRRQTLWPLTGQLHHARLHRASTPSSHHCGRPPPPMAITTPPPITAG